MSICFFICSIGRPELTNTLRSLWGQFSHGEDKIYVYFDGRCNAGWDYFQSERELYGDDLKMILLSENLGFWGHGIRNAYMKSLPCTHIHCGDDDDYYPEGVMFSVRNDIIQNPDKLLIYKFRADGGTIWSDKQIRFGNVGTPSAIFPNRPEIFGEWGSFYGGDFQFYQQTAEKIGIENLIWKDQIIYKTKPATRGM